MLFRSEGISVSQEGGAIRSIGDVAVSLEVGNDFLAELQQKASTRSEERRVGKECRSRWSP